MAWSIFTQGGGDQVAVGWAQQFLSLLNAPVTPGNVQFIYQWEKSEGGGGKYNPLNTGPVQQHPEWTSTGEQFGGGAADYVSWQAGQLGSAYYLEHYQQATYSKILNALRNNDPASARAALWASPWAASHYGYGANWSDATVPGGTAVLPPVDGAVTTASDTTVADKTCAVTLPVGGCLLSKTQVRALLGVTVIGAAVVVGLVGALILVANGLAETKAGRAAAGAVSVVRSPVSTLKAVTR